MEDDCGAHPPMMRSCNLLVTDLADVMMYIAFISLDRSEVESQ